MQTKTTSDPPASRPVVLIWDRCPMRPVSGSEAVQARVAECEAHARARGWDLAGAWLDSGEIALTADVRPQLDVALSEADRLRLDACGREREVILLVHSNDRLSNDALWAASLRGRIRQEGARLVLLVPDTDEHVCALPAAPPPVVADATVSRTAQ